MVCDIDEVNVNIMLLMDEMKGCKLRFNEIVFRLDYLLIVEYIDMMIWFVEMEK